MDCRAREPDAPSLRFLIDHSSSGGVAIVVATTMNTAAAYVPASMIGRPFRTS
jgi:hypothetical protein